MWVCVSDFGGRDMFAGRANGGMITKEFVLGGVIWGDKGRSCDIQLAQ